MCTVGVVDRDCCFLLCRSTGSLVLNKLCGGSSRIDSINFLAEVAVLISFVTTNEKILCTLALTHLLQ
ncbi:hypothetical protein SORBI_3001G222550 [Sorghum bicolor]|uniref:Uncharacterized protein n=1 Tax=Sorghum bicolor TaxID=4558 RepID=A0A1Z5S6W2_SORBI|nr:hypothetical protein SORBI_3001G222550 [Sorghum bicolor]